MKALIIALTAAALIPVGAEAATHQRHHMSHTAHTAYARQQIACTYAGCLPVPADCYPTGGKTFFGNPTGFDVMVCPSRGATLYGHL